MLALSLVVGLVGAVLAGEIPAEQAVHHRVGVAADGGGEVGVEVEGEAVVADVFGAVAGFRHRAEGYVLEGFQFGFACGGLHQGVDAPGGCAAFERVSHLISEAFGEVPEALEFFGIGDIVDSIDEGLGLLRCHAVHLSVGGDEFGDGAVSEKHEFFYEPVGFFADLFVNVHRLAVLIDLDLHFRAVEIHCPGLEPLCLQFCGQIIQDHYGRTEFGFGVGAGFTGSGVCGFTL